MAKQSRPGGDKRRKCRASALELAFAESLRRTCCACNAPVEKPGLCKRCARDLHAPRPLPDQADTPDA